MSNESTESTATETFVISTLSTENTQQEQWTQALICHSCASQSFLNLDTYVVVMLKLQKSSIICETLVEYKFSG